MALLRRCGLVAASVLTFACASAGPAKAWGYWGGGYRGYGYGGFGPAFGAGVALGGLYGGGYYPRPYYAGPPVVYLPPPVYAPPVYLAPPPAPFYPEPTPARRHRVVYRARPIHRAPVCSCLPRAPATAPAPLHDVPSPDAP
jgi:hypothetical protein